VKRAGLFNGYWLTLEGERIRRIRRDEYGEFYRLWRRHMDIRLGVRPLGMAPQEREIPECFLAEDEDELSGTGYVVPPRLGDVA
jgi:hypothetical protein